MPRGRPFARARLLGPAALRRCRPARPERRTAASPETSAFARSWTAGSSPGLAAEWLRQPPRIDGRSAVERAALGYLHGNCANCHNDAGPLRRLGLRLDFPLSHRGPAPAIVTTLAVASRFERPGNRLRVAAGAPEHSVLALRIAADDPITQMPPFGRHLTDPVAVQLIERWIRDDLDGDRRLETNLTNRKKP